MTEKQKEDLMGAGVLIGLISLVAFALYAAFNQGGGSSGSTAAEPTYTATGAAPSSPVVLGYQIPVDSGGGGCGCGCGGSSGGGCPSSTTMQSLNQILQIGGAAANQIIGMGNSTLQAIADIGNEENPLLQVTVG